MDTFEPPTKEEAIASGLFMEATDRLEINPDADISDLRAQVPESEKADFQAALEGYAIVHFANAKGWIDWDKIGKKSAT